MTTNKRLILASASPRRQELLELLEIPFQVRVPDVEEQLQPGELPSEAPQRFSRLKAEHIAHSAGKSIVLAADTVVVHEDEILGKPRDADHARDMLRRLRGKRHVVLSGITVIDTTTGEQITDLCESQVWMRHMDDDEIEAYIASGDPMDKAAAYGIQNAEFAPVKRVVGCPANVMGLPMCHVIQSLHRLGMRTPLTQPTDCEMDQDGYLCPLAEHVLGP
jgi:MAF protein